MCVFFGTHVLQEKNPLMWHWQYVDWKQKHVPSYIDVHVVSFRLKASQDIKPPRIKTKKLHTSAIVSELRPPQNEDYFSPNDEHGLVLWVHYRFISSYFKFFYIRRDQHSRLAWTLLSF